MALPSALDATTAIFIGTLAGASDAIPVTRSDLVIIDFELREIMILQQAALLVLVAKSLTDFVPVPPIH
jgi:hypothetical protein